MLQQVHVYDGESTVDPELLHLTDRYYTPLTSSRSSGGAMLIKFTSNSVASVASVGWAAQYITIGRPGEVVGMAVVC